VTRLRSI